LTTKTMFFLIDAMPSYNVLLGRDWFMQMVKYHQLCIRCYYYKTEISLNSYMHIKPFTTCSNHLEA
jgi:hypothetical protein